jgi:hypothetical protein
VVECDNGLKWIDQINRTDGHGVVVLLNEEFLQLMTVFRLSHLIVMLEKKRDERLSEQTIHRFVLLGCVGGLTA